MNMWSGGETQVWLVTEVGIISTKVVKVNAANDLALQKADGKFGALPVVSSRGVRPGKQNSVGILYTISVVPVWVYPQANE